jgi:tripartite-type tricarboxylate transporter receptor subunit TctC
MTHVPYKGGGAAIVDLTGGQIPIAVLGSSTVLPQHRAGRVRILAMISPHRAQTAPEIPTLDEAGVRGVDVTQWIGLVAPPKLPRELVERVNREVRTLLAVPATRDLLQSAGFEATPSSARELEAKIRDDMKRWAALLPRLNIRFD